MAREIGLSVREADGRPCINLLARQRSAPLYAVLMYRSRRVTSVRHALSATLLGCAALAHATTSQVGDDSQWTRVDLDNAPSLVIGAKLGKERSTKVSPTSKNSDTGHKAKVAPAPPKSGASQRTESAPAIVTPSAPHISAETIAVTTAVPALVPAQTGKLTDSPPKSVEPAQVTKTADSSAKPVEQPKAAAVAGSSTKKPGEPTPPRATPIPTPRPVSAFSALIAPALQLLPKSAVTAEPAKTALVEPAQPPASTKVEVKAEAPKVAAVAKPADAAKASETKAPATFALSPKDRTIRAGLERWTASAGWKLSWELDEKFQNGGVVRFDADFGTDFDSALSKLAGAMRSEVKTHAYLYVGNKVLRIMEEPAKPVVQPAVPMTPVIPDGAQRDVGDRGLPYVTRVKGYWLGASGTESEEAPPQALPPVFNASVSLIFSDKANLATVTGILSKVTGIAILLPGAIEYPAHSLFVNDTPTNKKKSSEAKGKRTYVGTPRALLDRISVSTGLLWEYKDETIVFTE